MRDLRSSRLPALLSLALAACGATPPPSVASKAAQPFPATPPVTTAAPSATPSPAPDASPTERTPEQKARDDARAPLANAILDAYPNGSPQFSRDRKKPLFASRRDGNRQYYLSDIASPGAAPIALTHGPQRASAGGFARDGKSILFLRDTGADENYRIYQVGLDGKNETCLTPGPVLHRYPPLEARGKPGTIVYSQRDVKATATEIVVQPIGGEPKVVYTDPRQAFIQDITADGKRVLMRRRVSSGDYVLFDLDLGSGKARRLFPSEGKTTSIHDVAYSADGKRAFVATDDGADGQFLYAIDIATGAIEETYRQSDPPTASVDDVVASPRGDRLAIGIDEGDHEEGRILDAKTLKVIAKVVSPLGVVAPGRFSEDGAKIAATITTPDTPPDVFAIDAITGAVTPLRNDPRPGLEKLAPMETSVATVAAFDGLRIPVIVFLPKGAGTDGKRLPVLVDFHGGPLGSSAASWDASARFYTSLGYAYLEPNVRGSTGYGRAYALADNREKRADWLKDLESVNAWTKAQPWADPARVIAMGGSYGGYTVLMALTRQPSLWRAGVDYVGIANLFTFLQSTDQAIRAAWVDEFGDLDKDKELLREFSPLRDVDKITAPLFVYAGQNDPRVPREESDQIVQALRARGVPVEYQVAMNEGHSMDHRENRVEFMTRVARFLEDHASGGEPAR